MKVNKNMQLARTWPTGTGGLLTLASVYFDNHTINQLVKTGNNILHTNICNVECHKDH